MESKKATSEAKHGFVKSERKPEPVKVEVKEPEYDRRNRPNSRRIRNAANYERLKGKGKG